MGSTTKVYGPIWIDPDRVSGTPCFTGTRVPVQHLFDYVSTGERMEEFLLDFPTVTKEQAVRVLELAGRFVTMERILHEVAA